MPTYVYAVILEDGSNGEHFEVVQPMSDDALTKHPEAEGAQQQKRLHNRQALSLKVKTD